MELVGSFARVSGLNPPEVPGPLPGGGSLEPLWAPDEGVGGGCGFDRIAAHLLTFVTVVSVTPSPNGKDLPASFRQSMMELVDNIIRMDQNDLLSFHDLVREGVVLAYIPRSNSSS